MDGWAGGQTDRQMGAARRLLTTWLGRAVLKSDGWAGLMGEGRK